MKTTTIKPLNGGRASSAIHTGANELFQLLETERFQIALQYQNQLQQLSNRFAQYRKLVESENKDSQSLLVQSLEAELVSKNHDLKVAQCALEQTIQDLCDTRKDVNELQDNAKHIDEALKAVALVYVDGEIKFNAHAARTINAVKHSGHFFTKKEYAHDPLGALAALSDMMDPNWSGGINPVGVQNAE